MPTLELVSLSTPGEHGNSWSGGTALSVDGRFIAFHSYSDNLVAGDTNSHYDIFVRDRFQGSTERVSVGPAGTQANASSVFPSISADGRRVAFASAANNLVPGDANGTWDVFVHDRASGETRLVSRSTSGSQGSGSSETAVISGDGRLVAFESFAANLAPDANGTIKDIFVHDLQTGQTVLASQGHQGQAADQNCFAPTLSGNGRLVAFHSSSTNLVPGDTNDAADVFLRDLLGMTTERVSLDSTGGQASSYSFAASLSADGRCVAFQSAAGLVPGDEDGFFDVYLRDLGQGATLAITAGDPMFVENTTCMRPSISGDGRRVAFQAAVVFPPVAETWHVLVHDRASSKTRRLSQSLGTPGNGDSTLPAISASGRAIGFETVASNLFPDDANSAADVLVHTSDRM